MMRWSCQRLQGCVPVHASATPTECASSWSCARRSTIFSAASANVSQRPVRTSTSDAISSPTMCSSSGVPCAAACSSSKRLLSSSVSRSRIANSSSTATVKSVPLSYASNAERTCSSGVSFCVSPMARLRYWRQEAFRHARPTPARERGTPSRVAERRALLRRQCEQRRELVAQLCDIAVREARERRALRRILRFEAGGDLGKTGVACNERRHSRRGGLGGDHAERLREDRGHDRDVAQRKQRHQVPVLERTGEERPLRPERLQLRAVVAEADDHGLHFEIVERLEQKLDALVVDELPEVDDARLRPREELGKALGVPVVRQALVRVVRVRWIASRLVEQLRERLVARDRPKRVDVDAGRNLGHAT